MITHTADRPILFFDGLCNLCDHWVQFVIRHDSKEQFLFASLQSERGAAARDAIRKRIGRVPDSLILFYKGEYYVKADAAIKAAKLMGGFGKLLGAGLIVPRFLRNIVYDWVARNRYKWFGKKDECMVPTPQLKARFLS